MDEQQYLTERLENQLKWYDSKSQSNQCWDKVLRLVEIVCAALIPFLAGLGDKFGGIIATLIGVLGVLIAICVATNSLCKFHENWLQYRATAEQLKHEKFLYLTRARPYNSADRFEIIVMRVESLISTENSDWSQKMFSSDEPSVRS